MPGSAPGLGATLCGGWLSQFLVEAESQTNEWMSSVESGLAAKSGHCAMQSQKGGFQF